ncbi:CotH kinase family protein [Candidatus Saccharibacteria bacterium]|nr:CotH kinase family protein [Candidatus Saccharibacteria bacterium]
MRNSGRARKKKKGTAGKCGRVIFGVLMLSLLAVAVVGGLMIEPERKEEIRPVAILEIKLTDASLEEINGGSKKTDYPGNTVILKEGDKEQTYEEVEIRGRGNFSWLADKKSYRLKFASKVDLLDMGKKKKWALVGNSVDASLMRNDFAYYLAGLLGGGYPIKGDFVHLLVDDNDLGLYYLIKTMSIDKQAVDLKSPEGILVEVDNAYCDEECYKARNGDLLSIKDVVAEDEKEAAMEDFVKDYNSFLKALEKKDVEKINNLIDMESFAKYFVLSEFTANPDAYITSWYLYKDGYSDKIHAGLAWDFDAAFGNKDWTGGPDEFYSPSVGLARFEYTFEHDGTKYCGYDRNKPVKGTVNLSWVVCDLLKIPDFREMVSKIYLDKIVAKKDEILDYIDLTAKRIREEAIHDAEIWNKRSFDEGIEYLTDWVQKRFEFFDDEYVIRRFDLQESKKEL